MGEERRYYYRVTDTAWIHVQVLNEGHTQTDPYADGFHIAPEFQLLSDMATIDQEYEALPRHLNDDQLKSALGHVERIDRKLSLINQHLALQVVKQGGFIQQRSSLSESGMSLNSPNLYPDGTGLHLTLMLPLTQTALCVLASVRYRKQTAEGGGYVYGLQFDQLRELDRQRLAKHIIHKQSMDIQALRNTEKAES